MRRGDVVTVAMQGDLGKPRPAIVIQADYFSETSTITVLPVTSEITEAPLLRITLEPSEENGLRKRSQVMVDKPVTVKREKIGQRVGALPPSDLPRIDRSLALFLGIAS
ncbi:MAG: type II toxin-antitoxin system PemK/MazF family toxin [Gammaproteobacteria bacterium]